MLLTLTILIILSPFITCLFTGQEDYVLIQDHMEVNYFNKEYLQEIKIQNTKYNRSTRTFGGSGVLLKDINKASMVVKSYIFLSNHYVNFAPMDFTFDYCKALKTNLFGCRDMLAVGNLTQCPLRKGTYYIKDHIPDKDKLPPKIPRGKYRVTLLMLGDKNKYLELSWYGTVKAKEELKRQH